VERHCPECDYVLIDTSADRCQWCGTAIDWEAILAATSVRWGVHRAGVVIVGLVVGILSLVGVSLLVSRQHRLSLRDGMIVIGILVSAAGHLALAITALLPHSRWPLRNRELASLVLLGAVLSILATVIGATSLLDVTAAELVVRGVEVTGIMEFVLSAVLFSLPGWMLLLLRFIAFQPASSRAEYRIDLAARGDPMPARVPFRIQTTGPFTPEQISTSVNQSPQPRNPAVEAIIEQTWEAEKALAAQSGAILYNGSLARLDDVQASPAGLHLALSRTHFRDFVGTNLHNAARVMSLGRQYLADPLGTGINVLTGDGFLVYGRRSRSVAFHAGFVHTFGGLIEDADRREDGSYDVMGATIRELIEELRVDRDEIIGISLLGIVRDIEILQPELIFDVRVRPGRDELHRRLRTEPIEAEHTAMLSVHDSPESVVPFIKSATPMTPVAQASLLLHGRFAWGQEWYENSCYLLHGAMPERLEE